MVVLNFVEEDSFDNSIKYKVVEPMQMNMSQMITEIEHLLKSKNVVDGELVVLNFTIIDSLEIIESYSYSKNFEQEFEEHCLRNLIPLYMPCWLRSVLHQKKQ